METPAALVITSGILASAVNGAIAAAIGEPITPSKMFTLSRVMSSWATRLPTSGAGAVVALDNLDGDTGWKIFGVLFGVKIDALLHLIARGREEPGEAV